MATTGCIYKITCVPTGKAYVGQTRDTKMKSGRPYAYGVSGRWNDHVSCPSTTPLGLALLEHGPDSFNVETLESGVPEIRLDEREAHWIATENTLVPNGYNKMRHGRCRHRDASTLAEFYAPTTRGIRLRQINRGGSPTLIYAYLKQDSGGEVRVVFGQGKESSYAIAVSEATSFLTAFAGIPVESDSRILNPAASEYDTKLARFDGREISRIRMAKFNTLAAVYVDKERICFGGKKSTYEESVAKALSFATILHNRHPAALLVNDASKSATGGCSSS
jgi:hypothetical protein